MKHLQTLDAVPNPTNAASLSAFGKKNRAQTPVKGMIQNDYGSAAEQYFKGRQDETLHRVSNYHFLVLQHYSLFTFTRE